MATGALVSITLAMLVVFYIDARQKIRQHSQPKKEILFRKSHSAR